MKHRFLHHFSTFYLVALTACTSSLSVNSDPPGFEVYLGKNLVGRTPLSINESDLASAKDGSGLYVLKLLKSGYSTVSLVVPKVHSTTSLDLNLRSFTLADTKTSEATELDAGIMQRYFKDTALALAEQAKIAEGQTADEKNLSRLRDGYPDSSAALYLSSLSYLTQGKKEEARKAVAEALKRNPWDDDAEALSLSLETPKESKK